MTPEILLVDDENLIATSLATYLEDDGLRVTCAGSAEEAIARVSAGAHYQVCIMDIRLPGMDGSRAVVELHRIDQGMQFLIHTGSSDYSPPARLRALGVGPERLFRKPLADMAPLARTVRALADAEAAP
jgi:CheY-like chemotaxis protein